MTTETRREKKIDLSFSAHFPVIMPTADALQQELFSVLRFSVVGFGSPLSMPRSLHW
jgi:hypothetical protein